MKTLKPTQPHWIPILLQPSTGKARIARLHGTSTQSGEFFSRYTPDGVTLEDLPLSEDGPIEHRFGYIIGVVDHVDKDTWPIQMQKAGLESVFEAARAADLYAVKQQWRVSNGFSTPTRILLVDLDEERTEKYDQAQRREYYERLEEASGLAELSVGF